jgi:hypothetical protein
MVRNMVRIQFELPEDKAEELESLMELTSVATKKEFLNNALTLLEWAINERLKGRIIASVDEQNEKYREVLLPILARIKPTASVAR